MKLKSEILSTLLRMAKYLEFMAKPDLKKAKFLEFDQELYEANKSLKNALGMNKSVSLKSR